MERHLEWLNTNSERSYPLINDGIEELPYNLFLDASIVVPRGTVAPIYISKAYRSENILTLVINDSEGTFLGIASNIINKNSAYQYLELENLGDTVTGVIVLGNYSALSLGVTEYTPEESSILNSVTIVSNTDYVHHLVVDDESLNKDVEFVAGEGLSLSVDKETNSIIFALIHPEQFLPECDLFCSSTVCNPLAIYQLNSVLPDSSGNIDLLGDTVVQESIDDDLLMFKTPLLTPNDFCDNRTGPSPGPIGPVGPSGPIGPDGVVICGVYDCECTLCDVETGIDECENIVMQCLQVDFL